LGTKFFSSWYKKVVIGQIFLQFFFKFSLFFLKMGMKFISRWTKKVVIHQIVFSSSMIHEDSFLRLHKIICYIFWLHYNIFTPQWSLFFTLHYTWLPKPTPKRFLNFHGMTFECVLNTFHVSMAIVHQHSVNFRGT
jgi:hypothetical protein